MGGNGNSATLDHAPVNGATNGATNPAQRRYDYGGNPLAHMNTGESARFPAFGGEFQPGLYKPTTERKFANPAPLGLSAFALTTFVLSLINIGVRGVHEPNIVALAFGYGGLVQLLAGMWEMAVGNTFGATALSSYGGFWLSLAIVLTPGGFEIVDAYAVTDAAGDPTGNGVNAFNNAFGYFLAGWFIFTTLLLICTLARPLHSSCCSSLWTWHSCSCSSDTCTLIPRVTTTPDRSRPVDTSVYLQLFWRGTMPWLVLRMTAIPSSSFPSHTSHGLTRDASARPGPSARPSSRLPRLANNRAYLTFEREMEGKRRDLNRSDIIPG